MTIVFFISRRIIWLLWILNIILFQESEAYDYPRCFWDFIRQKFDPKTSDSEPKNLSIRSQIYDQNTCAPKKIYEYVKKKSDFWSRNRGTELCNRPLKHRSWRPADLIKIITPKDLNSLLDIVKKLVVLVLYSMSAITIPIAVVLLQLYWSKKLQDPQKIEEMIGNFSKRLQDIVTTQMNFEKGLTMKVEQLSNVIMPMPDPFVAMHSKEEILQYLEETVSEIEQSKDASSDVLVVLTPSFLNNLADRFMSDPALNRNIGMITTDSLIKFANGDYHFNKLPENEDTPTIGLDFTIKVNYGDDDNE